jgi:predicted ATPase/class 3 adenylate cyclase/DNA-binding CsgD family transcriptional regulator
MSEVDSLRWDDIHLGGDRATLHIRPAKGGKVMSDQLPLLAYSLRHYTKTPMVYCCFHCSMSGGEEQMIDLPTGTVTFLFTDIEGSTAHWQQHQEVMPAVITRHDLLLRDIIAAHAGAVFKLMGDAACAAFANAFDALAAALAAQRALHTEPWGEGGPLRVRMAIHTGVIELHDGDYHGLPLSRIARLLAAGHGGQILLSRATQELVRDHLPPGTELRDLGEHRLKDLFRPEQIFQLVASDLPTDFPPLRTLDQRPTNLPAQATPLIGREREVAAVCALVQRPEVRLLTLTGPGGTGKTRLGLQVAAEMIDAFTDGVYFVALAAISDPAPVLSAIAQALGLSESGSQPLHELLHAYVRNKHVLLLLDNFEQVLAAGTDVATLLEVAPRLKVLITSRTVLHLYGEHEYVVPSLTLPDPKHLPPLERLTQYEAVRLFIARAQAAKADFAATNANAPAIAEICVRLDGLPLAIELAAARIKILAPQALLARLSSRLNLLTGGARTLPARQQTLRSTIDWSYGLLDAGEQRLFAQLGVFVRGCTLDAAEAICTTSADQDLAVLDGLASLVDKSLLQQQEQAQGEPRFTILETIREYALERLDASGTIAALQQRHAAYYLALAEEAYLKLEGAQQVVWLERLEAEHDNMRATLRWALHQGDFELAARLGGALWRFWLVHGHLSEGSQWLAQALTRSQSLAEPIQAQAFKAASALAWAQGDFPQAWALSEASLALYRKQGDAEGIAGTLGNQGVILYSQGDYVGGRALLEESLALNRGLGDAYGISVDLTNLGVIALIQEDYVRARAFFEESLTLDRELGDRWGTAISLWNLGLVTLAEGDSIQAQQHFEASLTLSEGLGDQVLIASCLEGLAGVAEVRGQSVWAARFFGIAEVLREAGGTPMPLSDRKVYERYLAAARAQLGEAAFAAAWAEGRTMTLEQALAALAQLPPAEQHRPPLPSTPATYPAGLTEREVEVLRMVAQGLTNAQIAEQLVLSPHTVNAHVRSIFGKLDVTSRAAATRFAMEQRLV